VVFLRAYLPVTDTLSQRSGGLSPRSLRAGARRAAGYFLDACDTSSELPADAMEVTEVTVDLRSACEIVRAATYQPHRAQHHSQLPHRQYLMADASDGVDNHAIIFFTKETRFHNELLCSLLQFLLASYAGFRTFSSIPLVSDFLISLLPATFHGAEWPVMC